MSLGHFTCNGAKPPCIEHADVFWGNRLVNRYYHVMKKEGQWHLYAGNAISALMVDLHRANILKAARTLARHNGAKVILHRDDAELSHGAPKIAEPH